MDQDNIRTETPLERAERIGCVHVWYLSWARRCENCRTTPLSPSLPDPKNPGRDQLGLDHPE